MSWGDARIPRLVVRSGGLGIRRYFESQRAPGQKLTVDEYYGYIFEHEFQWMAAKGYVVLFPNPRGSTTYGQEFGNVIQYHYPGDDFKDLMAGVDELVRRGYIDEKQFKIIKYASPIFAKAEFGYFDENGDGRITKAEFVDKPSEGIVTLSK